MIAAKADFVFETTLSSEHSIKVIERAKEAGFLVNMIFVCLDTATRNVERVRFRVADGGHDIPEEVIIGRYEAAFENLPPSPSCGR
ncbi:zeta toxin family protein [Rhizobium tumorigenes]|uniref:zeta toxin family protein n=1 Tax=Rhizobium tumorigenes TaxID=2041385 RepID=UPI000DB73E3C